MNRKFDLDYDGELFSAYLDGMVNADERKDVEKLLAESAEARSYFESLQALQGAFAQWQPVKPDAFFLKRVEGHIEEALAQDELTHSLGVKLHKYAVAAMVLLTMSGLFFLSHLRQEELHTTNVETFLSGFLDQDVAQVAVMGESDVSEELVLDLVLTDNVQ